MIRHLHLTDIGPSRELTFSLSPRLNVLTGDNGLGKTFVLDVIWWVLTTTWVGEKAFPRRPSFPMLKSGDGDPIHRAGDRRYFTPDGDGGVLIPEITALLCHSEGPLPSSEVQIQTGGLYAWESQEWHQKPWKLQRKTPGSGVYEEGEDEARFRPPSLVVYVRIDGSFAIWDALQVKGGIG